MDEQKYINIARQLIEKSDSRTYTVISNSMSPFLRINDKVVCRKISKIKKYSVIAFYNTNNKKVPLVHRVVKIVNKNNRLFFKTKGDNALTCDKELINSSQIIGEVYEIIRNGKVKQLDTKFNKIASLFFYLLSILATIIKYLAVKIKNIFSAEPPCVPDENFIVLRQSVLTKPEDWLKAVKLNNKILETIVTENTPLCDISFGGGYCEESFNFIRKGQKVDYIRYNDGQNQKKYDVVICARVINIVDSYDKRQTIYMCIKNKMSENGKVLISYMNYSNGFFLKLKREIMALGSKYIGPKTDDMIYENIFVAKSLYYKSFLSELNSCGFKIISFQKCAKTITAVCTKN